MNDIKTPWNKWWTFTLIAAVIGIIAIILGYLGYLDELGNIIAGVSFFATIVLGLRAATEAALTSTRKIMREEHGGMVETLEGHTKILKEQFEVSKEHSKLLQEIRDPLKR